MATHSSILALRILWTEEPGGLWSMGLQRVSHDWSDLERIIKIKKKKGNKSDQDVKKLQSLCITDKM